ncbi:ankyrin repeat and SOCS box protein 6-like [Podarcis raffonei]|uniref:ankyrin repeat and SOCS box protein 6-like n=1 Tax=Podarcis raffonei TaxID=65483 RepID=UPI0023292D96|nr:ankyrin repeat and SOCS box protein 6-like [Podarcis raffonei]
MPFLHGFSCIYEYQGLVNEILECMNPLVLEMMDSASAVVEDDRRIAALRELLERNTSFVYYQEGVSYSLLKMAVYGMVRAAESLLHGGADITFEGWALGSSDGVQIHNTESIRLFLEGGANVKATTKDGDTIFSSIISLLWKTVGGDEEEAQTVNRFCFQVTQLPMTHRAKPSECPTYESLTHVCLKNFQLRFPLLEFGARYNCTIHGPACWSGFSSIFEWLCSYLWWLEDDTFSADLFQKAETVLELLASSSQIIKLPSNFDINLSNCRLHRKRISDLFTSLKKLEHSTPTLKHMCRVFLWQHLRPWPKKSRPSRFPTC